MSVIPTVLMPSILTHITEIGALFDIMNHYSLQTLSVVQV